MGANGTGHAVRPRGGTGKAGSTRATAGKNGLKPQITHPSRDEEAVALIAANAVEVSKAVDALSTVLTFVSPIASLGNRQLRDLIKEGKFVGKHNGKRCTWKTVFRGNQHVKNAVVNAQKIRFVRVALSVRGLSGSLNAAGGAIAFYRYQQNEIGEGELIADLMFSGIAFVPPHGWMVSGVYFMGKEVTEEAIRFANTAEVWKARRIIRRLLNNDRWTLLRVMRGFGIH